MSLLAHRWISLAAVTVSVLALAACAPAAPADSEELVGAPETAGKNQGALSGSVEVGSTLIATANVNLRSGPSTSDAILHVVPTGSTVTVLSADPQNGFYNVKHNGSEGWSYGKYYKAGSPAPDPTTASSTTSASSGGAGGTGGAGTGGAGTGGAGTGTGGTGGGGTGGGGMSGGPLTDAIARASSAMGFSYWWGHGRFRPEGPSGSNAGTCSGSCPSCSHGGSYGGDCSGLVAKVWQVPSSNADLTADAHPYSTSSFVHDTAEWSTVSRSNLQTADAMVYNAGGHGHIFIYSSGDGWGSMDAYECKGCAYGCVHNLRSASSAYHGIRRAGY